jgi:outer membrane protein assembly factor BamB
MNRAILIVLSCCLASHGIAVERLVPDEYAAIQKAIDAAQDGDVVIVRPGTYWESVSFRGKAITVRASDLSGWPAIQKTIISGHYARSSCVIFDHGETQASILEGFTLRFAQQGGPVQSEKGPFEAGGGVLCVNSSPTIRRCCIAWNNATYGGGIALFGTCQAQILNCFVVGNGAAVLGGAILVRREVAPPAGSPSEWPRSGAGYRIASSRSGSGEGNSGTAAGPIIVNCTIADNRVHEFAPAYRYDVDCVDTVPTILNTIIYGSYASLLISDASRVSYCCLQETHLFRGSYEDSLTIVDIGAQHNILGIPPGFVGITPATWSDASSSPYHLKAVSACVNAGSPALLEYGLPDIDGQPRVMAGRIDIGADEVKPSLILTSPGSARDIRWSSSLFDGAIDLLLSRNGGQTWDITERQVPNEGQYTWHMPDSVDANECMLLISPSSGDPNVTLTAAGLFAIHPIPFRPAVEVAWPSLGGDAGRSGRSSHQGPDAGRVKWQFETGGAPIGSITVGSQGRVHVACEDGKLYTLDAKGKLLWTFKAGSALFSSPTVGPDGSLYVGAEDGRVYAVDVGGKVRWTYSIGGPIYSSPAVAANGNVYVGAADGAIHALTKNGEDLWCFGTKGPGIRPKGAVFASPTIGKDGSVYVIGLYDPNLYALDAENGRPKWKCRLDRGAKSAGWAVASPVVGKNGTIYQVLVHDPHLYAIEPRGGTILWATDLTNHGATGSDAKSINLSGDAWSEPVLGPDGTIHVITDDPYLRAVDPNGHLKWMTRMGDVGASTLMVDKRGFVYAASEDGSVHVVSPEGVEETRFVVGGLPTFPVLTVDDSLVVADSRDYSLLATNARSTVWAISAKPEENER